MNNKLKVILPVLLVSSSVFVLFQIKNDSSINQSPNSSDSSNSVESTDQTATPTSFQKLSVLENRCRGCGKCARIDSAHFEMINGVAKVISSTDLDSKNLAMAISSCHDQAITLE